MVSSWLLSLFLQLLFFTESLGIRLIPSPGALPTTIPAACCAALSSNITCPDLVPASFIGAQRFLNNTLLNGICTTTCAESLLVNSTYLQALVLGSRHAINGADE